jgi:hypothetical protein
MSERAAGEAVDRQQRLQLLVTVVLVGTVASVIFHYVQGYYLGHGYPRSTFLDLPSVHFSDWDNTYRYAQHFLHRQPGGRFVYFPFAFLLACLSTLLPLRLGFVVLVGSFLVVLAWLCDRLALRAAGGKLQRLQWGFVLIVLSYPVLFVIDRGNYEMLVFIFIAAFVVLFERGRTGWAAAFLALAIAMKLYPATLLIVLLARRRYRACAGAALGALLLTGAGIVLLAAWSGYSLTQVVHICLSEKSLYQSQMVTQLGGLGYGHSLWGAARLSMILSGIATAAWHSRLYDVVAALIFVAVSLQVLFREKVLWRQVLLLTIPGILLPFVSADYTLIQLYVPLLLFLAAPGAGRRGLVVAGLFGLLLVPADYYYFALIDLQVSTSVFVYPLALLGMLYVVLRSEPQLFGQLVALPAAVAEQTP